MYRSKLNILEYVYVRYCECHICRYIPTLRTFGMILVSHCSSLFHTLARPLQSTFARGNRDRHTGDEVKSSSAHKLCHYEYYYLKVDKTGEENVKIAIYVRDANAVSRIAKKSRSFQCILFCACRRLGFYVSKYLERCVYWKKRLNTVWIKQICMKSKEDKEDRNILIDSLITALQDNVSVWMW